MKSKKVFGRTNSISLEETRLNNNETTPTKSLIPCTSVLEYFILLLKSLYVLLILARFGFLWIFHDIALILSIIEITLLGLLGCSSILYQFLQVYDKRSSQCHVITLSLLTVSVFLLIIEYIKTIPIHPDYILGALNCTRGLMLLLLKFPPGTSTQVPIERISKLLSKVSKIDEVADDPALISDIHELLKDIHFNQSITAINNDKIDSIDLYISQPSIVLHLLEIKEIDSYNFDIFAFQSQTSNNPLLSLMVYFYTRYNLPSLGLPKEEYTNFFVQIQANYKPNPYHNSLHASDVVQSVHFYLSTCDLYLICELSLEERGLLLISSAIHDFKHPGLSNAFLVNTGHRISRVYNDQSVLENYHLSSAFEVIRDRPRCNLFAGIENSKVQAYRRIMICLVLHTDFEKHKGDFEKLQGVVKKSALDAEDRLLIMEELIHAGDISNASRNWNMCNQWADLVMEEFFNQGDIERERNLNVSPMCDRYNTNIPEVQIFFISNFVMPVFQTLQTIAPKLKICVENCVNNMKKWEDEIRL